MMTTSSSTSFFVGDQCLYFYFIFIGDHHLLIIVFHCWSLPLLDHPDWLTPPPNCVLLFVMGTSSYSSSFIGDCHFLLIVVFLLMINASSWWFFSISDQCLLSMVFFLIWWAPLLDHHFCRNRTLAKCGGEAQHSQSWGLGVLRDSRMFRVRQQGPKLLALRRY
jgi:hypothetical protein